MKEKLKNLPIERKLTDAFAVLVILFAISLCVSISSIVLSSRNLQDFYEDEYQIVQVSQEMKTDLQTLAKSISRTALAARGAESGNKEENVKTRSQQVQTALDSLGANLEKLSSLDVRAKDLLVELQQEYETMSDATKTVLGYYENNQVSEGLTTTYDVVDSSGTTLGGTLDELIEKAEARADDKYSQSRLMVLWLIVISIVLAVAVVVTAARLSIALTRVITNPLKEMENAARELATGNLSQEITYSSKDELGALADGLRDTIASLRSYIHTIDDGLHAIGGGKLNYQTSVEFQGDFISLKQAMDDISTNLTRTIRQIDTSADQVASGAEQIAGSSQALSQATLEQASSVEELSATINDVSARVQESAENAVETSRLARDVGMQVTESSTQMEQLRTQMEQLSKLSGKMSGIIKDIEDIAFQTNILALNAAVEAARAGDAGRGFGVVANEIRRLSTKTTEASRSTGSMIRETLERMEESAEMAGKTSEKLLNVADAAKNAADKVEHISRVSNEQATAVVQLRESIEQISDVVQENSATAEESAASGEELTGQMQMLRSLVDAFEYDMT